MIQPKRAIVSLANERGNYYKGLCRLGESLKDRFDGDFFGFMGEHAVGAPKHLDNPYAFKIYAISHVLSLGYRKILWLDSSVVAVRNVAPAFDYIDKHGYLMQQAGAMVKDWCNEFTAQWVNLTEEEKRTFEMYGNAGMLGLDFNHGVVNKFFEDWESCMFHGLFKGSWENHRHDMTCGSIIANRLGMTFVSGNEWLDYAQPSQPPKNETIIFHAAGM